MHTCMHARVRTHMYTHTHTHTQNSLVLELFPTLLPSYGMPTTNTQESCFLGGILQASENPPVLWMTAPFVFFFKFLRLPHYPTPPAPHTPHHHPTPLSVHWALNEIMHYQSEHHHHLQAFQLTCGKLPLFEVIHEMTSSFRATITRRRLQNTTFKEREELKWNQTQVLPLTSLMPNRLPKPAHVKKDIMEAPMFYLLHHVVCESCTDKNLSTIIQAFSTETLSVKY